MKQCPLVESRFNLIYRFPHYYTEKRKLITNFKKIL